MATYKYIKASELTMSVLVFLSEQSTPVSGREVARALNVKYDTVMCHLYTLDSLRFARKVGDHYELGQESALLWARKKTQLTTKVNQATSELRALEG